MPSNRKHSQLGSVLLSFPSPMEESTPISWDEYKVLTGVDLNDIFSISISGGKTLISFRPDLSKLIYVKFPDFLTASKGELPTILPVSPWSIMRAVPTVDPSDSYISFIIYDNNGSASGYAVDIIADKTIQIKDDF